MKLSRQRLEDNPANYDGEYHPIASTSANPSPSFKPWKIYPPPPSPHWTERDPYAEATETTAEIATRERKRREFKREDVDIPGKEKEKAKGYRVDKNGVYQVYDLGSSIFLLI